jgi:dihydrolipoamide dehydrogenase
MSASASSASSASAAAPRPADLSVDLVVLGAGTAGLRARVVARARGLRVLLVDPGPLGTTCARVGCMPSKLLIAAAEAAHAAEGAHRFGADLPRKAQVDGPAVMARVRRERDRFVGFTLETTDQLGEDELWRGRGRLLGGGQVGVTGADGAERVVSAGAVVIATGSRPQIFPMFAALGDRMIVNDDVFDWTDLPRSVAVVGAGGRHAPPQRARMRPAAAGRAAHPRWSRVRHRASRSRRPPAARRARPGRLRQAS